MKNLKISAITLFILLLIFVLHLYGMQENLYIKFWFYDIIMHVLGGVGIAMSVYSVALFFDLAYIKQRMWTIILLTFIAGLAWEYFEIFFNLTGSELWSKPYYIDTVKDLFDDTLGAVIVCTIINKK
jgi:hypothetical protein